MSASTLLSQRMGDVSPLLLLAASILAPLLLVPVCTYIITNMSYRVSVYRLARSKRNGSKNATTLPPTLPYALPFLGSALSFLSFTPGKFWRSLQRIFALHPSLSILTVYMGGRKLHVLHSPTAVTSLFKLRHASRNGFNKDVIVKGMGLNAADAALIYGSGGKYGIDDVKAQNFEHRQTELYNKYLLSQSAVNSLTAKFTEVYNRELTRWCDQMQVNASTETKAWHSINLVDFVKRKMFVASTEALYGTRILEIPDLADKYWAFDTSMLARFYGLPRFMIPESYRATEELHAGLLNWVKVGNKQYDNDPPMDIEWEEWMGSTFIRSRRRLYKEMGMSDAGQASFDLGFMFGLTSNAIPATTWMLCHLLAPSNAALLAKLQQELETARRPGGKIDIPTLLTLPHLNSAFSETLRQYVDVLVTRELRADTLVEGHRLGAGDVIMAPQYLGHHDPKEWNYLPHDAAGDGKAPPETVWFGERFLKYDEKTGKPSMSTRDTAGKFFPWGGGTNICPGRVFAKQEVFAGVATFLLNFEVRFDQYTSVDKKGNVVEMGRDEAIAFPVVRKQYSGNGVVAIEGDVRVAVRRRVS